MIAVDMETTMPTLAARVNIPVCLSFHDGTRTATVTNVLDKMTELVLGCNLDKKTHLVFHNGGFDLGILAWYRPEIMPALTKAVWSGWIKDTFIIEKLLFLSERGEIPLKMFGLDRLTERYLKKDRTEDKHGPDSVRTRYGEMLGKPISEYPEEFIRYAEQDVIDTLQIYLKQRGTMCMKGPGSANTQELQLLSAIYLQILSFKGIRIDPNQVTALETEVHGNADHLISYLVEQGFAEFHPKTGKFQKKDKKFREYLLEKYPSLIKRTAVTASGGGRSIKIGHEDLLAFPPDELIQAKLDYLEEEKLLTTFLPQLVKAVPAGRMYPNYDVLKETGRISSFSDSKGEIPSTNIQQPPKRPGVRECYIADEGKRLVSIDYGTLELCVVAQQHYGIFQHSRMMEMINKGYDLHSYLGSILMSHDIKREITYEQFRGKYKEGNDVAIKYRTLAKPINLALPGGMGFQTLVDTAWKSYKVDFTLKQARIFKGLWLEAYPEMQTYFQEYLPSREMSKASYCYETNGRFRNKCTYCSFANGHQMQSLAADGFKRALIMLMERDRDAVLVPFHDEFLLQFPDDETLEARVAEAGRLMIKGMHTALPNVRLSVEANIMQEGWTKAKDGIRKTLNYSSDELDNVGYTRPVLVEGEVSRT